VTHGQCNATQWAAQHNMASSTMQSGRHGIAAAAAAAAMQWHSSISDCDVVLCIVHVTRFSLDYHFNFLASQITACPRALPHKPTQMHAHTHTCTCTCTHMHAHMCLAHVSRCAYSHPTCICGMHKPMGTCTCACPYPYL